MRSKPSASIFRRGMLWVVLGLLWASPAIAQQFNLTALKARSIVGFATFVEWRGEVRPPPIVIGILGDADLCHAVEALAVKYRQGDREIETRSLDPGASLEDLDLLYIAGNLNLALKPVFAEASRNRVLTVGEAEGFIEAGGMIKLFVRKNRLRFDVNLDEAEANGMILSSKLLRLAESTGR